MNDIFEAKIVEMNLTSVDESEWIPGPRPRRTKQGAHEAMVVGESDQDFVARLDRAERQKTDGQVGVAGGYVRLSDPPTRFLVETMRVDLPYSAPYAEISDYELEAKITPEQNIHSIEYRRVTQPRVILQGTHCPYCFSDNVEATAHVLHLGGSDDAYRLFACHSCQGGFALEKELDGTPVV